MDEKASAHGEQFIKQRKRWKRWQKVVSTLACVVVFCTTYALILPAITMEHKAYCGYEEHAEHSVKNGCYTSTTTLICDLSETTGHTHDDTCYSEASVLICTEAESAGHQHSDACFETTQMLTCEKPIHTHQKACFSDSSADVETRRVWERTMEDVELTGNWSKDVLAIAASQLGYKESSRNYIVNEDGRTLGYTRYGAWYGNPYGDWCAMFASFCLNYAQVDRSLMPIEASCSRWIEALSAEELNRYFPSGDYTPSVGDLVFFDWDRYQEGTPRSPEHVGLVAELIPDADGNVTQIKTIEGNSADKVQYVTYDIDDTQIMGYGQLPKNPNPAESQAAADLTKSYSGADYTITVTYTEAAAIPQDAELQVQEIALNSAAYQEYYKKAAEALNLSDAEATTVDANGMELTLSIGFARFFDISFVAAGEEIEPAAPVDVVISYENAIEMPNADSAAVVHFADTGVEVLEVETKQSEQPEPDAEPEESTVDTFAFTQDSFSVTGTVITTNWIPFGDLVIMQKDSTGDYYAINKDGQPVKVTYQNGTVYCAEGEPDIIWTFNEYSETTCYFANKADPSKYLTMARRSVNIATNKTSIGCDYDQTKGWYLFYKGSNTTYYMNFDGSSFSGSRDMQTVYFASNVVYAPTPDPDLPDPTPQNPGVNSVYNHFKTIDYLGDGVTNRDTTLYGEDLYRLYLDMTGIRKPVDLLLVVDASGSMKLSAGTPTATNGITNGMPEVIKFLNGTKNPDATYGYDRSVASFNNPNCDGFIRQFFELNSLNRLAITAFGGYDPNEVTENTDHNYTDLSSNPAYRYTNDTWLIKDWNQIGDTYTSVPVAQGYFPDGRDDPSKVGLFIERSDWIQGTNYSAALMMAQDMFDNLPAAPKNPDRIQIMVFLSDGHPTYSIIKTADTSYPIHEGIHYVRRGQGQNRYYDPTTNKSLGTGTYKTNDCYYDSELSFERFHTAHPSVINYSIGFKITSEVQQQVLRYMGSTDAERTNADNYKSASNYSDIMNMILGVFKPRDVTITDTLSPYVDLYSSKPDVKVTMTPKSGGEPILLWSGFNPGAGTSANTYDYKYYSNNQLQTQQRSIVKGVLIQEQSKTITAQFDEHYSLDQNYTYAVSFNVRATDTAYDTYATSGYAQVGDNRTDHGTNITSSGKPGLFSNALATVSYTNSVDGTNAVRETVGYDDPVIQVDKCDLTLTKVGKNGKPLTGAVFTLADSNGSTIGTYTMSESNTLTIPSTALTTGTYTLRETTAPEKYLCSNETISFTVDRGMITFSNLNSTSDWTRTDSTTKTVQPGQNGQPAYPKNQLYHYALTITNTPDVVESEIILQKTDDTLHPLNGATFTLYRDVTSATPAPNGAVSKTFTINGTETSVMVEPVAESLTSAAKTISINGTDTEVAALIYYGTLTEGTYYLYEDAAPPGYNTLEEPIVIQIGMDAVTYKYRGTPLNTHVDGVGTVSSAQIPNTTGYQLPSTGGAGTTLFTIGGTALIAASLLYGLSLRRKRERRMN